MSWWFYAGINGIVFDFKPWLIGTKTTGQRLVSANSRSCSWRNKRRQQRDYSAPALQQMLRVVLQIADIQPPAQAQAVDAAQSQNTVVALSLYEFLPSFFVFL